MMTFRNIDHIGIACRSLEASVEFYRATFGLTLASTESSEEQGVREAMLPVGDSGSYIQLLEPLSADTPVGRFLDRRGEGIHHIGYAVENLSDTLASLGQAGVRLIDSRPRHGSMGACIAFLHPASVGGVLTELVQIRAV